MVTFGQRSALKVSNTSRLAEVVIIVKIHLGQITRILDMTCVGNDARKFYLVELTAGRLRAEGRIDHRLGRNSPEGCLFSKGDRGWAMAIRDS